MIIIGIDPGSKESGYVVWDSKNLKIIFAAVRSNTEIIGSMPLQDDIDIIAIERIRGYGIVAGDDTFDTCEWIGRFDWMAQKSCGLVMLIPRKAIKHHLCGNTTTNDKYIRMALIDRFGDVGTKKKPGPLYGIAGHLWAALACCVYAADQEDKKSCEL